MHHSEPMGMGGASGSGEAVVDNSLVGGHHSYQQQQQMHQQQQVPTSQHLGNVPMGVMGASGQQVATKVDASLDNSGYGLIPPHSRVLNEVPSMYSQMVSQRFYGLKLTKIFFSKQPYSAYSDPNSGALAYNPNGLGLNPEMNSTSTQQSNQSAMNKMGVDGSGWASRGAIPRVCF